MPIEMIVTDLDNTLLKSDKTISAYTASVFRRCHERGIRIVIATARPHRTVRNLPLDIPKEAVISNNGALVTVNDIVCSRYGIEIGIGKRLVERVSNRFPGMNIALEIDDVQYANFDVAALWTNAVATRTDFSDLPDKPVDKIMFCLSSDGEKDELEGMLPDDLHAQLAEDRFLMVMDKKASKYNAVREMAARFGIDLSSVVAFGDDYNEDRKAHV